MSETPVSPLLARAVELEAYDELLAAQLEAIETLAARTAVLRHRSLEIVAALDALPGEIDDAGAVVEAARVDERAASAALAAAESRVGSLGRRARQEERDQAERELTRAREELHDAGARLERAVAHVSELDEVSTTLHTETAGLLVEAAAIAAAVRESPRVADAGKDEPGETLAMVEEWGARARAALFVARGTLAGERERIVLEANALGASVLGEELGGSSVSLVRRRVEQALAG